MVFEKVSSTKGLDMLDETTTVQKLAAEALGTAFLVFIGVGSVPATLIVNGKAPFTMADLGMISFAFGMVVVATVYAFGHISGNHINPAVTLGLAVSGKFPWSQVPAYIGAQVVGAIVGEFVGTFILVLTIFGAIHRKAPAGFAGLAIGFVVFAAIIPVAPATGASINPARTFGPMLVQQVAGGTVHWSQLPVYLAAELLAGVAAAYAFGVIARTPADRKVPQPAIDLADPESTLAASVAAS